MKKGSGGYANGEFKRIAVKWVFDGAGHIEQIGQLNEKLLGIRTLGCSSLGPTCDERFGGGHRKTVIV